MVKDVSMESKYPKPEILSKRITLRKHSIELAERMFAYVDSDRRRLRRFLFWVDNIASVADEEKFVRDAIQQWHRYELFDYGIFRNSDAVYMGNIGVHSISWRNECAELGYWICGEFEGQGYVTEAVLALEGELFGMGFNRIEIRCSTLNDRSARVPERLGYALEGTLRKNAYVNGEWYDTKIFGKLKQD